MYESSRSARLMALGPSLLKSQFKAALDREASGPLLISTPAPKFTANSDLSRPSHLNCKAGGVHFHPHREGQDSGPS